MREIKTHETNEVNSGISLTADEPGPGGASHLYRMYYSVRTPKGPASIIDCIKFQSGPIGEVGINGVTNEVLLAIVIDRLHGFQSGQFSCRENALALTKIEEAMHWLHARTRSREFRGVEGTSKP